MTFDQMVTILAAPFILCVILIGIHCYLGLHVLARGVIFVDLSLAQVAAFGSTLALLLGFEHHSSQSYFIAFGSTLIASAIFAFARRDEKHFPQEAIIGITYALGSALVVLVIDKMAHGAEHLRDLLVGEILWVTWSDVRTTAMIYAGVGLIHFLFRRKLIAASFDQKSPHVFWDFIFYALFGVVITSSVHLAGVLQVFSVLIVPAILSQTLASSLRMRLILGWIIGIFLTALGMMLSIRYDMPSGAVIVVCFTAAPLVVLIYRTVLSSAIGRVKFF